MKKFYICKETATLNLKQQARAEKEMRKKIAEWDGGDILNVVFDGEIQNRIDWDPEELGVYSTLEEAQEAANSKNIESSAWVYGSNLELVAYYIEERDYFEGEDGYYESCGMYDIPREAYVQEAQRV